MRKTAAEARNRELMETEKRGLGLSVNSLFADRGIIKRLDSNAHLIGESLLKRTGRKRRGTSNSKKHLNSETIK